MDIKLIIEQELNKHNQYMKWKRENVTFRGIKELGKDNEVYGSFGKGLYTVPLSNKSMAKQYGKVYFVVGAKPKNPKIVNSLNDAEIVRQNLVDDFCKKHGKNYSLSFFEENTSMEKEMLKLGYDGLVIKGREMVNYSPNEDIRYFENENQLIQYYEYISSKKIKEGFNKIIDEDYPSSFDIEYFKSLTSFDKRIKYCNDHLKIIGGGSSRISYKIDNEKVLKLAKNKKGLAQNEVEVEQGYDNYISDIVTNVFDFDEKYLWIEAEFAKKVTPQLFKKYAGIDFDLYKLFIYDFYNKNTDNYEYNSIRNYFKYNEKIKDESLIDKKIEDIKEHMWENNEFTYEILNYIGSYDVLIGDLQKLDSYGIVKRNGEYTLVVIDYGLSPDLFKKFYQ